VVGGTVEISRSSLCNLVKMIASNDLLVCKIESCGYSCLHVFVDTTTPCNLNGIDVFGVLCNHMIDDSNAANTRYPNDSSDLSADIFRYGILCRAIPSFFSCSYLHACCICLFCDNKAGCSFDYDDNCYHRQRCHSNLNLHHNMCDASLSIHYNAANNHFSCLYNTT